MRDGVDQPCSLAAMTGQGISCNAAGPLRSDPLSESDGRKDVAEMLETAHRLADAAGKIALSYFRTGDVGLASKTEDGFDPVTRADREIEFRIREILAEFRPDDAILGEEFAPKSGTTPYTWVIDPIDGTRGFVSGTPTWGTLIAVNDGARVILGMIDQPFTGERFFGTGGSAWLDRHRTRVPLSTRSCRSLSDAVLFSTFPEIGTVPERAAFAAVSGSVLLTRYGLDCYAYALLAAGHVDLVIEAGLNPHDVQAPIGLVEAAGGIVTDWEGRPVLDGGQVIAAGDRSLHELALGQLAAGVNAG